MAWHPERKRKRRARKLPALHDHIRDTRTAAFASGAGEAVCSGILFLSFFGGFLCGFFRRCLFGGFLRSSLLRSSLLSDLHSGLLGCLLCYLFSRCFFGSFLGYFFSRSFFSRSFFSSFFRSGLFSRCFFSGFFDGLCCGLGRGFLC